jgi:two-component system, response regulator
MTNDHKHILIIDDDSNDVYFAKKVLRKVRPDWTISVASDGDQALKLLSEPGSFQLILLDLKLPGKGGIEILNLIKAQEQLSIIPVLVLSSSTLESDIKSSYNAGAVSYIHKSHDFNQFSRTLENALNTVEARPNKFIAENFRNSYFQNS